MYARVYMYYLFISGCALCPTSISIFEKKEKEFGIEQNWMQKNMHQKTWWNETFIFEIPQNKVILNQK